MWDGYNRYIFRRAQGEAWGWSATTGVFQAVATGSLGVVSNKRPQREAWHTAHYVDVSAEIAGRLGLPRHHAVQPVQNPIDGPPNQRPCTTTCVRACVCVCVRACRVCARARVCAIVLREHADSAGSEFSLTTAPSTETKSKQQQGEWVTRGAYRCSFPSPPPPPPPARPQRQPGSAPSG